MKPDEVLDMSLDVLGAVFRGYADRLHDQQILAVQSGYWSGYWSNSKHPKSLNQIVDMLTRKSNKDTSHADDVDVEAFLERERKFNERRDSLAR